MRKQLTLMLVMAAVASVSGLQKVSAQSDEDLIRLLSSKDCRQCKLACSGSNGRANNDSGMPPPSKVHQPIF